MDNTKKRLLIVIGSCLVLVLALFFLVVGCHSKYEVSFMTDGGSLLQSLKVNKNGTIERSEDPVKEGYEFEGWYIELFAYYHD